MGDCFTDHSLWRINEREFGKISEKDLTVKDSQRFRSLRRGSPDCYGRGYLEISTLSISVFIVKKPTAFKYDPIAVHSHLDSADKYGSPKVLSTGTLHVASSSSFSISPLLSKLRRVRCKVATP